jgi:hypothetical protein
MLFFISYLMAPLWHATHGNSLALGGWSVPIPTSYWRFGNHQVFFVYSYGAPIFRKEEYGSISAQIHQVSGVVTEQRITAAVMREAAVEGYVLEGRKTVQSAATTTYCFQFIDRSHPAAVVVRCVASSGELYVFFEGNRRFVGDVYEVVNGLRRLQVTELLPLYRHPTSNRLTSGVGCSQQQTLCEDVQRVNLE